MNLTQRLEFGRKLRFTRHNYGTTQQSLANYLKTCISEISKMENGVRTVTLDTLKKINKFYGDSKIKYPQTTNTQPKTKKTNRKEFNQIKEAFLGTLLETIQKIEAL